MVAARYSDSTTCIDPAEVLLFSDEQFREREVWNLRANDRFHVPHRFDGSVPTFWSPVISLRDDTRRLLPTSLCFGGFTGDYRPFGSADSIGCAAGNTLEEAVLSALYERIERDAVAIWWYSRAALPVLDCRGLSGSIDRLLIEVRSKGLWLTVLDITTDIQVPTYAAVGTDSRGRHPHFGASANHDSLVSVGKAIEEMLQMHHWASSGAADPAVSNWLAAQSVDTASYLVGEGRTDLRVGIYPGAASPIDWALEQTRKVGLEAYFVNLTRPEIGLPTARVIIPGARHVWHRLAPGRLYSVPAKLGWVTRELDEHELNPVPCPL